MMRSAAALLRWQRLAYWRRLLRGGTAAKSNLVVLGALALAGFARYLQVLRDAANRTAAGDTASLELLLAGVLCIALLPVWDAARMPLGSRDLGRFPLAPATRFALRAWSRLIAPLSWILAAVCVAGVWPVLALPHPIPAALAYVFVMAAGFGAGLALADFAGAEKGRRMVWTLALAAGGVAAAAWLAGARHVLLPTQLILEAGRGQNIAVFGAAWLASLTVYAALRTLPWMLNQAPPGVRARSTPSAAKMSLSRRDFRMQSKLAEVRTVWLVSAALAVYLAAAERPEPDALRVMLGVLAFLLLSPAMNAFGADGAEGLDRLFLWPVSTVVVIAAKNRAFFLAAGFAVVPLVVLSGWRFGWGEGASNLFEAMALALIVLAWGNVTSVRHPENGAEASGSNLLDGFVAMVAIAAPAAASIAFLRSGERWAPLYILAVAAVGVVVYAVSLRWSARYLAVHHESIRALLA